MTRVHHPLARAGAVWGGPGPGPPPRAVVPPSLTRVGPTLVRAASHLLDDLGYSARLSVEPPLTLTRDERAVYDALGGSGLADAIASQTGLSLAAVTTILLSLELKGLVRTVGGRYERTVAGGPSTLS